MPHPCQNKVHKKSGSSRFAALKLLCEMAFSPGNFGGGDDGQLRIFDVDYDRAHA